MKNNTASSALDERPLTKLCVNCKFMRVHYVRFCHHELSGRNPVDGTRDLCMKMRSPGAKCGDAARLWEWKKPELAPKRKPLLHRLMSAFRGFFK